MPKTPSPARFEHIDAMRAVAVFLVMWTHYAELFAPLAGSARILNDVQVSWDFGRIGVVIFFCISGMLIPTSLKDSYHEGTRCFLIRRFFRLFPAFWLSLPIGYFAYWMIFGNHMSGLALLANVTMVPGVFGMNPVMGHYWTLETELYFYLFCLVLFWCGCLHTMRYLCLVCAGLCVLFVSVSALHIIPDSAPGPYRSLPYNLAIMFWGACFRQAYDAPSTRVQLLWARGSASQISASYGLVVAALAAMIILVALLMAAYYWRHSDNHVATSLAYVAGIAIFLVFATILKIRTRLFAWLGKISYSIYLLHGIALYLLFWVFQRVHWVGGPLWLYMIAPVVPSIALSWLSYRLCEAPFVKLARTLTAKRAPDEIPLSASEKCSSISSK
ncbi:acyltransferase family protein [Paraburkholderia mimosarum]|uniref:acyltransferase family protein n=1 Tax=Paraburkholderia mimosarum TaxID=312026 RepID=UPI0039C1E051